MQPHVVGIRSAMLQSKRADHTSIAYCAVGAELVGGEARRVPGSRMTPSSSSSTSSSSPSTGVCSRRRSHPQNIPNTEGRSPHMLRKLPLFALACLGRNRWRGLELEAVPSALAIGLLLRFRTRRCGSLRTFDRTRGVRGPRWRQWSHDRPAARPGGVSEVAVTSVRWRAVRPPDAAARR